MVPTFGLAEVVAGALDDVGAGLPPESSRTRAVTSASFSLMAMRATMASRRARGAALFLAERWVDSTRAML